MSYQEIQNIERTARKNYRCIWCDETISAKSRYRSRAYKFDGEFTSDAMHVECYAAMLTLHPRDLEDGFGAGSFNRGCCCERGRCECAKASASTATPMPLRG